MSRDRDCSSVDWEASRAAGGFVMPPAAKKAKKPLRYEVVETLLWPSNTVEYLVLKPTYEPVCRCRSRRAAQRIARALNGDERKRV